MCPVFIERTVERGDRRETECCDCSTSGIVPEGTVAAEGAELSEDGTKTCDCSTNCFISRCVVATDGTSLD